MKRHSVSTLIAASILVALSTTNASFGSHGNRGPAPGSNAARVLGSYATDCNNCGDAASSSYQNLPSVGSVVRLRATQYAEASVNVEGLDTHATTMLGGIQFSVSGNIRNFSADVTYTAPGASSSTTKTFTRSNGGIQNSRGTSYYIGTQNANGSTQIPPGSTINAIEFELNGNGGSQITADLSNVFFVGYGTVGYNLSEPAAFCDNTNCGS